MKTKVIDALQKAAEPALIGCSFSFGLGKVNPSNLFQKSSELQDLQSLFRNDLVQCFTVMSQEQFDKLKCKFKCKYDPKTKKQIKTTFTKSDFSELKNGDPQDETLFKLAAKFEIDQKANLHEVEISTKYQVLCNKTCLIGVVKQKNKGGLGEEMTKFRIPVGMIADAPVPEDYDYDEYQDYGMMLESIDDSNCASLEITKSFVVLKVVHI